MVLVGADPPHVEARVTVRVAVRASLLVLVFILIVFPQSKSWPEALREIPLPYTAFSGRSCCRARWWRLDLDHACR